VLCCALPGFLLLVLTPAARRGRALRPQVYRALCKPTSEIVAIKILDLERQDPGKLVRARGLTGRARAAALAARHRAPRSVAPLPSGGT
jgi:hypothetical protein